MIALLTDAYRPKIDGISIALENLVSEFQHRKIQFDLFAPDTPGIYQDAENIYRFPSTPAFFQPEIRLSIPIKPKTLRRAFSTNYQLVHSHAPGPLGILATQIALLRRIPHFHTFHTHFTEYTHYLFNGRVLTPKVVIHLSKWWVNKMDFLIAPSGKILNWLREIEVKAEIRVIPSGINLEKFSSLNIGGKGTFLIEKGIVTKDDFILLFVGRLGREKAIDQLIQYFADLHNSEDRAMKLVIAGDGPERQSLEALAVNLGIRRNVVFLGYVQPEEMPALYQSADIFTFLSTTETQGVVVVEAIASGLPVLLVDDEAFIKMIEDGKNGFFVRHKKDFIRRVDLFYENDVLRRQFSAESARLSQYFDIKNTTGQLLDFYNYGCEKRLNERITPTKEKMIISIEELKSQVKSAMSEFRSKVINNV